MKFETPRALRTGADTCVLAALAILPVLAALRVFEYVVVRQAHVLPANAASVTALGLRADLALVLWLVIAFAVPVIALAMWRPLAASRSWRAILVLVVVCVVALVQYFAVTFVPLGADLFGYSLKEIRETTMSSKGVSVLSLLPFIAFGAATWFVTGWATRRRAPGWLAPAVLSCGLLSVLWPPLFVPQAKHFASDGEYFLAHNTGAYFAAQAVGHFAHNPFSAPSDDFAARYPLLHKATDEDVLGPYLNPVAQRPNLVFVIVEGLGRDFVGQGAAYGGFTPFIDSLSRRGLFWDNFLSTSGRTFGVLPAMFGSLPVVDGGLLEMGAKMPRVLTLQSLLKARGYRTNYFTGTDGHYDMIDLFMERQGIDSLVDVSRFGPGYEKEPASEGGESWGYGDLDLFKRSFASIGSSPAPRLDVYLTITTHEPFIPPNQAAYAARFEKQFSSMTVSEAKRADYRKYANVFETMLYLDDAVRFLVETYSKREDFRRTIFFITGDHRLIPIPPGTRMDRYRVPFIMYSPMLKAPHVFESVSSHQDVTPSVVAMLHHDFGMTFPDTVPWVGTGIDTATAFRNTHTVPLMRTKGSLDEILDGSFFLSGDQLFAVRPGLDVEPTQNASAQAQLEAKLDRARKLGRVVATQNRVVPGNAADSVTAVAIARENAAFDSLHITGNTPEQLLGVARDKAVAKQYDAARVIARKLLRDAPNYHDARALLGRTYAWERRFDEARAILQDLVSRAPEYEEGYVALASMEVWANHGRAALDAAVKGLSKFPNNAELAAIRLRALAEMKAGATE